MGVLRKIDKETLEVVNMPAHACSNRHNVRS
jgi:hypothetical protein